MKSITTLTLLLSLGSAAQAAEQKMLARVTSYWVGEGESGKLSSTGHRLRDGHCAVDPKRIPYGSRVTFPDGHTTTAVDTGPDVISRKAARACGRTPAQKGAIVVDRFFESKRDAVAWTNSHPEFMTVQVATPESRAE
jgi:3D (Asp-Asp-Asp) domain-containing protein